VRRTRPLAIHDFVEVVGCRNVGIPHRLLVTTPAATSTEPPSGRRPVMLPVRLMAPNPDRQCTGLKPEIPPVPMY
jgi:hypothetical protein